MFLAQNFKKFLKKTIQESESSNTEEQDLFQAMRDVERGCGLDPNNTATAPAFKHLMGNSWHHVFCDD